MILDARSLSAGNHDDKVMKSARLTRSAFREGKVDWRGLSGSVNRREEKRGCRMGKES